MSTNLKTIVHNFVRHFVFTKHFEFRTVVPVDLSADRLSDIPFNEGKSSYTVETESVGNGYLFDIWEGNRYQREPSKARIIGTGTITRRGNETIIQGEVRIGLNRMLMLSILTFILTLWTYSLFTIPFGFLYLFYTGGLPIVAPIYLLWQSMKKRNMMLDEIKQAVTPHLSDRRDRLSEQESVSQYISLENEKLHRSRR